MQEGRPERLMTALRAASDEVAIAARFEQIFYDSFHADTRPTLAVVCFALGTWVGGMYTTSCCRLLAAKGYPIIVISPGRHATGHFHQTGDPVVASSEPGERWGWCYVDRAEVDVPQEFWPYLR
jgi:hypothetical protein